MMDDVRDDAGTGRNSLGAQSGVALAARLAIGTAQGCALYALYRAVDTSDGGGVSWPATAPELFGPLVLVAGYLPFVLLAGVTRMRLTTLAVWSGVAAAFLAMLGWHDVARQSADALRYPPYLQFPLLPFAAAALFISHHLIAPADRERRWIASFPAYFDTAWKAGVQLALSVGFTGAFWILLHLGAALFDIIGLKFLESLIREEWFVIPVTCLTFALAVHLSDVRDGLIRGVRSVVLMLLSWLLLVITVLVAGFLAALPFTGLSGLWGTGSAAALVLGAAAALIILINTAYQDGRPDNLPPAVLRIAVRVAAVLVTPLVVIALWALALRIGQYGLTPDRIVALACAVVGVVYAGGYGYAALRPFWRKDAAWMRPLERTNVVTAVLSVALIVTLFSPVLDPARLSVADQVARLERGAVAPGKFDYAFLRFESGKAGQAALERLTQSKNAEVAKRAKAAQAEENAWEARRAQDEQAFVAVIEMAPASLPLPAEFLVEASSDLTECRERGACVGLTHDVDGDDGPEVLIATEHLIQLFTRWDGSWMATAYYNSNRCGGREVESDKRALLRSGAVRPVPARTPDLEVLGHRVFAAPSLSCLERSIGSGR